jgi:uncharacterized damage-inducible protein DinB
VEAYWAITQLEQQAAAALPQVIHRPGPQLREALAHMVACSQLGLGLVAGQGQQEAEGQQQEEEKEGDERILMLQVRCWHTMMIATIR